MEESRLRAKETRLKRHGKDTYAKMSKKGLITRWDNYRKLKKKEKKNGLQNN